MHIDATNFDFILSELEEPPRDYIVYIDEDFYVDGIIETIFLADTFSAGPPFDVNILSGTSECSQNSEIHKSLILKHRRLFLLHMEYISIDMMILFFY